MDTSDAVPPAAAVVALKPSDYAKSRLDLPAPLRQRLAETMALDTLRALATAVSRVVVVSGQPALASRLLRADISASVVPEPVQPGMNAALTSGADRLRADGFSTVVACVGDLPALRVESVVRVLQASVPFPRAFLADATGVGTTMLVARDAPLAPDFQGRSAARHRAGGAVPLTDEVLGEPLADARRDVDTEVDLVTAVGLGVGPFDGCPAGPRRRAARPLPGRSPPPAGQMIMVSRSPSPRRGDGWCCRTGWSPRPGTRFGPANGCMP